MYVCLCKAVTDGQIREAVAGGCASMKQLAKELGVATQCGKCGLDAKALIEAASKPLAYDTPYVEAA